MSALKLLRSNAKAFETGQTVNSNGRGSEGGRRVLSQATGKKPVNAEGRLWISQEARGAPLRLGELLDVETIHIR